MSTENRWDVGEQEPQPSEYALPWLMFFLALLIAVAFMLLQRWHME